MITAFYPALARSPETVHYRDAFVRQIMPQSGSQNHPARPRKGLEKPADYRRESRRLTAETQLLTRPSVPGRYVGRHRSHPSLGVEKDKA